MGSLQAEQDFASLLEVVRTQSNYDWKNWFFRKACGQFPRNLQFLGGWVGHAALSQDEVLLTTFWTVLRSLPPDQRAISDILAAMAQAGFILGKSAEAEAALETLRSRFPDYDLSDVFLAKSLALRKIGAVDEAVSNARLAAQALRKPPSLQLLTQLREQHAHREIVDAVENFGGVVELDGWREMEIAIFAYEAIGRIETAFETAKTVLEAAPDLPHLAQVLRLLALRLDRLDEVSTSLQRSALALSGNDEGFMLLALIAIDQGDYPKARRIIGLMDRRQRESFASINLTLCLSDPSVPKWRVRWAYRAYRRLKVPHAGPEMQYASYVMNNATRRSDLREALSVAKAGLPYGGNNPFFHRMYLSILVANGLDAEAGAYFDALPAELKAAQRLTDYSIYRARQIGDHESAKALSRLAISTGGYRVTSASTTPPTRVTSANIGNIGPVTLFCVVRNGADYIGPFLEHYRKLGVRDFVFVDNGSTDGTPQVLSDQPDVSLYSHEGSFKAAAHGVAWINPLIQSHAAGRWALFVDIDEHLVFPHMGAGRTIGDLVAYGQSQGAGCFPSFMLDLFPTKASANEGMGGHRYFDKDYLSYPSIIGPFQTFQGGVRGRMTGRYFLITKSPLVRVEPDFLFLENNHVHSYLPPSEVTTTLLHYKFLGDPVARFREEVQRKEHYMGGRFYQDMLARMTGAGLSRGIWTRRYLGDDQLVKLGLMNTSDAWRNWK